jgi:cytochrome c biogenesis protein CcmG, thiol:disulfide interchange protein DsbE
MTRVLKLSGQAVALAMVAGLLALLVWRLTHESHAPKIGGPAPAFSLKRLDGGGTVGLASLRGKPIVLNFWASWCPPCKAEAAALETAYRQYKRQGVVFLGIDYHDVSSDARRFLSHHGVTYATLEDGSGMVGDRYGLFAVPETFFVDRHGRLVGFHIKGPITDSKLAAEFKRGIEAALNS